MADYEMVKQSGDDEFSFDDATDAVPSYDDDQYERFDDDDVAHAPPQQQQQHTPHHAHAAHAAHHHAPHAHIAHHAVQHAAHHAALQPPVSLHGGSGTWPTRVMVNGMSGHNSRRVHRACEDAAAPRLLHWQNASPSYETMLILRALCTLNCGALCRLNELLKSHYVAVYENKIEWNESTTSCCCACTNHWDAVRVVYFDRDITNNSARAACCSPALTHCSLCPTCCDLCGEGVVLFDHKCCPSRMTSLVGVAVVPCSYFGALPCCCRNWTMLRGFENADTLVRKINEARERCRERIDQSRQADRRGSYVA